MIPIALCDDSCHFTGHIDAVLGEYCSGRPYLFDVSTFFDGKTLLNSVVTGSRYDIIFLDIEMKGMDGICAAREIRRLDENVLFIYVSAHDQYLRELLDVHPFGFLKKPFYPRDMYSLLDKAMDFISRRKVYFHFSFQHKDYKLLLSEILYFESNGRKIMVHIEKDTYAFYSKLDSVEESLRDAPVPFLRIHQSYLVNYYAVRIFSAKRMELNDGKILPVSMDRQKIITQKYHALLEEEF